MLSIWFREKEVKILGWKVERRKEEKEEKWKLNKIERMKEK